MLTQSNQSIVNRTDTYLQPLLSRVLENQRFGACRRAITIFDAKTKDGNKCDCIDLSVPYADIKLKWTVLFDSEFPESGPDFIFNDETFLADPDINTLTRYVPSLFNWNYCNCNSLLLVLKELLAYYKRNQIEVMRSNCPENMILEYQQLMQIVDEDNVEVIIMSSGMKMSEVKFFIRLTIDFSKIPQKNKHHPSSDDVMLLVTFSGSDFSNVVPSLFLTKTIENILGSQENLKIPHYPHDELLVNYVPKIKSFLKEKVDALISNFKKKRDFMSALLVVLRGSIIEYDALEFSQATFLVEKKDFHFFIHFRIPHAFPRERPEVTMSSAYHMDQSGRMIAQMLTRYHYNWQMDPIMMVQGILKHIEEKEVDSFQHSCTKKNRY